MNTSDLNCLILKETPHFGNSRFLKAIEQKISLHDIIHSPSEYKKQLVLREETINFLKEKKYTDYLNKVYTWLKTDKHHLITFFNDKYPTDLKHISNPPTVLYCKGDISLLKSNQLAIVGSRSHTSYGKNVTEKIIKELKGSNLSITSGLAYGIDSLTHKFAIENNVNTIAVVGTGIDVIYPSSNKRLFHQISNQNLIVSEFSLGTAPLRHNFPQRNRVISGLSKGVLVIEAANKSGSLITAQLALEQNKEVFAIPGSIFNTASQGCNDLIKQGAKLVCNAKDICDELDISMPKHAHYKNTLHPINTPLSLSNSERLILENLSNKLTTLDQIINYSNLPYNIVTEALFNLELQALIRSVPGGYARCE